MTEIYRYTLRDCMSIDPDGHWIEFYHIATLTARCEAAGWQPIATAPKDGSRVLVWRADWCISGHPTIGYMFCRWVFNRRTGTEFWNDDVEMDSYENEDAPPTHWLPIPSPPFADSPEHP